MLCPARTIAADENELLQEQLSASGASGLTELLPEETQRLLKELGVGEASRDAVFHLSLHGVLQAILRIAVTLTGTVGQTMLAIWGILLLSALLECIGPEGGVSRIFHTAAVLCCGILLLPPLQTLMDGVQTVMTAAATFLLSFVPVFAGIMAAGGQAITAGKYAALTIGAAQSSGMVLSAVILPLLRGCMAMSITASAVPSVRIDGLCNWVRKTMTTLLSLTMTLFMSVLALHGTVGGAADSLADRTAQFVIGNSIPVVGGALSQAYGSVRGYVRLLKSTVGAFGMIAAGVLILPQLVSLMLWRTMLDLSASAGEMLGQREISNLLRTVSALLGVLLGIVLCSGLMVIVSTGVMLLVRGGA